MIIYRAGKWQSDCEPEPRDIGTAIVIGIFLAVAIAAYI